MPKTQAQHQALPQCKAALTDDDDDDDARSLTGLWDDQAWSAAEKEHQMARHRRKDRQAPRPRAWPLPLPPAMSPTIILPEKFSCPPLPQLGQIESFEEALITEF